MKRLCLIILALLLISGAVYWRFGMADSERETSDKMARPAFTDKVKVTFTDDFMMVRSDGLPDHQPGQFPDRLNANSIQSQRYVHKIPLVPVRAEKPVEIPPGRIGIMLNGVIFNSPVATESYQHEGKWYQNAVESDFGMDDAGAHPNSHGEYHYHVLPKPLEKSDANQHSSLLGFAFDGFPIYGPRGYVDAKDPKSSVKRMESSYRLIKGRPSDGPPVNANYPLGMYLKDYEFAEGNGDLDECNGRFGPTPEFPQGIYHYHATVKADGTPAYPYFIGMFRGVPESSNFDPPPPGPDRGKKDGKPPKKKKKD